MIGGVCGGLGTFLNVDPILFRVLFLVALIIGGSGLLVYIILWIVLPEEAGPQFSTNHLNDEPMTEEQNSNTGFQSGETPKKPQKSDGNLYGGLILIALGAIFLIIRFVPRIDFGDLWPLILIVIGVILIAKSYQQPK